MKSKRLFALVIALLVLVTALPPVLAQRAEYVFIEAVPGKMAAVGHAARAAGAEIRYEFADMNVLAVTMPGKAVDRMRRNPNVVSIESDPERYPATSPAAGAEVVGGQVVPWGIDAVQAPLVWAEGYLGEGVTVCVIDTGLYAEHEDLVGLPFIDGYSQVDDEWDFDGYGHGTHVVGTIGAVDNDLGVIGVSPGKVNIYMVKIFDNAGEWVSKAHASDLIAAARTCADNGAQIISMSLSGTNKSGKEKKAFDTLYAQGILSVGAASNDGIDEYHYPASYDSVISVAAIDSSYTAADFSQYNDQVELAAPGVGVLSTLSYIAVAGVTADGEFHPGVHMEYAPYTPEGGVSGLLVEGGLCLEPGAWTGAVVLCQRGDIGFVDKVNNVMAGGGVAAVIYNNEPGDLNGTMGEEGDYIPAIGITQDAGLYLMANMVGQVATVEDYEPVEGSGYAAWDGTSMATPHVSGVAALLWSANPSWTNVQIREAMAMTALDLGDAGRDVHYGYGLVQAYGALEYLEGTE